MISLRSYKPISDEEQLQQQQQHQHQHQHQHHQHQYQHQHQQSNNNHPRATFNLDNSEQQHLRGQFISNGGYISDQDLHQQHQQQVSQGSNNIMPTTVINGEANNSLLAHHNISPTTTKVMMKNRQRVPLTNNNNQQQGNIAYNGGGDQQQQPELTTGTTVTTIEVVAKSNKNMLKDNSNKKLDDGVDGSSAAAISVVVVGNNNNNMSKNNNNNGKDFQLNDQDHHHNQIIGHVNHGYASDNDNYVLNSNSSSEIEEDNNSESTELGSSSTTTGQQTASLSITSSSIIDHHHHQSSMIIEDKKQNKKQKKRNNVNANINNNNNNNNTNTNNHNNNNSNNNSNSTNNNHNNSGKNEASIDAANNNRQEHATTITEAASFKKGPDQQSFYQSTASSSSSSYNINLNEDHLTKESTTSDSVCNDQNGHARRRSLGQFSNSDISSSSDHFEINWSNLSYRIEPKWYKKFNLFDRLFPQQQIVSSASSSASSTLPDTNNSNARQSSDENLKSPPPTRSPLDPIEIFSNLNGTIRSGQLTAVLGPSGAGKTTLLNCLTGKFRNGVTGHINLIGANGKKLKMCTIPQKDHLLDLLTVEENLWFASKIKNPERGFDHAKNIEKVVNLLGLKRCRGAKIKKISGGQHKRVSIAQELLSNPDILVLDEPTSGLDSLTCFKTVSMLRDLVELSANNDYIKPMAIIVTIHQPQPKVFNLFHHVYILANGGRVIFEGGPETALETITNISGIQPNASSSSGGPNQSLSSGIAAVDPASFLIEIASEEYGIEPIEALSEHQRRVFTANNQYQQYRRSIPYVQHQERDSSIILDNHLYHHEENGVKSTSKSGPQALFAPEFDHSSNLKSRGLSTMSINEQTHQNHLHNGQLIMNSPNLPYEKVSDGHKNYAFNSRAQSHAENKTNYIHNNLYVSEQLQFTNEANHKGKFWSHTATLTHRTLLTIRRDPLLMTSRVLFHLMIPILMAHVYGKATGAANACPHYEPEIDITQIPSLVGSKRIESMLEELHMSIENVSMFFIIMYAFAAAVLALNALSFPLNMQVLLKETRNGWYSMSSFVVAKTIADLPLELTMPTLTMALVYPLTGQPSSYLQWRMMTICLIMTLCSLIAQTQALILGALVMNSIQTAVFVSQASQLPWVILAGFTIRIKRLSEPLKLISLTSFYRLGCEAITLTRYGFGICPCDPQEITGEPVKLVGIPDQMRTLAQYWIDSLEASKNSGENSNSTELTTTVASSLTTTQAPALVSNKNDIFQHLATQLSYANSYGVNITSCDDVAPDRIRAINLGDNWLVARIWHLIIMLVIMKIILYYAVQFSIRIRL